MAIFRFTWLGLAVGATYWLLESVLHVFVFSTKHTFSEAVLGSYDPNEIFMRVIIIVLFVTLGFVADMSSARLRKIMTQSQKLNQLLAFLSEVNQVVQRNTEQKPLLDSACRAAVDLGGFRVAWIGMQEENELKLASWAVADPVLEDVTRQMKEPMLGGCVGSQCVLQSGEAALCKLREKEDCHVPWLPSALAHGCEHAMALPLKVAEKTVGVFEVYAGEGGQLSEDEQSILKEVADDISVALVNIEHEKNRQQAEEKLQLRLDELERFQKATVQREFRIKELRDEIADLKGKKKSEPKGGANEAD